MNKKLRILYKEVGKEAIETYVENTLKAKQNLVGGLIEIVPFEDVLLVCNEEGKLLDLKPNLLFDYDYIAGNCFVIGDDYQNADFRSLTDDEIQKYKIELEKYSLKYSENSLIDERSDNDEIQEKDYR